MSKNDKSNVANLQVITGMTPSTNKHQQSSTSTANDRTEDDVGDEMEMCMLCDECKKLCGGLPKIAVLECGHHFCAECAPAQKKEPHLTCGSYARPANRDTDASQNADHDGILSHDDPTRAKTPQQSRRSRRDRPENHIYAFLYNRKPVIVNMSMAAPFSELIDRLYMTTNTNRATHIIILKAQRSSSEEAEGEFGPHGGEPGLIDMSKMDQPMSQQKLPKTKMMILEVQKRKPSKREARDPAKNEEKKFKAEDPSPLPSPNNSQAPHSN